jgi:hypothetical protein
VKTEFHFIELMEVEIISWKLYMIMEFFFDIVGFKHQHLFRFNYSHDIE